MLRTQSGSTRFYRFVMKTLYLTFGFCRYLTLCATFMSCCSSVIFRAAEEIAKENYVAKFGELPPLSTGVYIGDGLPFIGPVNRRSGIRIDENRTGERDDKGSLHCFAKHPFVTIWYNGRLAGIRNIPIGTHLHGYFDVLQEGEG